MYVRVNTRVHLHTYETPPRAPRLRRCLRVCIMRVYTRGCTRVRARACYRIFTMSNKENAGPVAAARPGLCYVVPISRDSWYCIPPFVRELPVRVRRTQREKRSYAPSPSLLSYPLVLPPDPRLRPYLWSFLFLSSFECARREFQAAETCHFRNEDVRDPTTVISFSDK